MTVAPLTLDAVRDDGAGLAYPRHLLVGCETALVLFAAAFHGRQDAYWIADAGLTGTCVDLDQERLDQMAAVYPAGWRFVCEDVYAFAESCGDMFDVVSIDCPTGAFERCAELVPLWCDLARHAVILGTDREIAVRVQPPSAAWRRGGLYRRSDFKGGVYWSVLEVA